MYFSRASSHWSLPLHSFICVRAAACSCESESSDCFDSLICRIARSTSVAAKLTSCLHDFRFLCIHWDLCVSALFIRRSVCRFRLSAKRDRVKSLIFVWFFFRRHYYYYFPYPNRSVSFILCSKFKLSPSAKRLWPHQPNHMVDATNACVNVCDKILDNNFSSSKAELAAFSRLSMGWSDVHAIKLCFLVVV